MKRLLVSSAALLTVTFAHARGLETGTCSLEPAISAVDGFRLPENISAELRMAKLIRPRTELALSVAGLHAIITEENYRVPVVQGTVAFTFSHILVSARRSTLALWADLEAAAGYELVNGGSGTLPDGATLLSQSAFLWGAMASLRLEIPLSRRTALSIRIRERAMPPSTTSLFHTETAVGVRIRL